MSQISHNATLSLYICETFKMEYTYLLKAMQHFPLSLEPPIFHRYRHTINSIVVMMC